MILLVLTSHRLDCFNLCIKCLEAHTDLQVFENIYVLGNELAPAHREYASAFVERHPTPNWWNSRSLPACGFS